MSQIKETMKLGKDPCRILFYYSTAFPIFDEFGLGALAAWRAGVGSTSSPLRCRAVLRAELWPLCHSRHRGGQRFINQDGF